MGEETQKELQLLPSQSPYPSSSGSSFAFWPSDHHQPSLDLKLSISVRPMERAGLVESLKWQAAEEIRLAAVEKAYAERVRELTRREMELAHSEFERARQTWQRARAEVEKAERMKERATGMEEITCQSCRQRFRP